MTDRRQMNIDTLRASDRATLTRVEVAELFGVDPRSVTRAIEAGEITAVKFGNRVLIPREPLLKLLLADQGHAE